MTQQLKLFVWPDALWNYEPGIMFALAENVEQAKELLRQKFIADKINDADIEKYLAEEPEVHDGQYAHYLYGGG